MSDEATRKGLNLTKRRGKTDLVLKENLLLRRAKVVVVGREGSELGYSHNRGALYASYYDIFVSSHLLHEVSLMYLYWPAHRHLSPNLGSIGQVDFREAEASFACRDLGALTGESLACYSS